MATSPNILIVGAGPTGLTAAVELARHGIIARVVDSRPTASGFSRAVAISPQSLRLLSASGVTRSLLARAVKLTEFRFYHDKRLALAATVEDTRLDYPYLLGLPQDQTEAVLTEHFQNLGGHIEYATTVVRAKQNGDLADVCFENGDSGQFAHVIGADGIRSTIRQQAGIEFAGYELDEDWSIADVDATSWPHPKAFTANLIKGGNVCVVAPIGVDRYRVVATSTNALATLKLPLDVTRIRREGVFRISVRQATAYTNGRLHLAGDAAHCHSPVGGRGMNLGIADACALADCIRAGRAQEYHNLRHAAGKRTIVQTERMRRMITSTNPAIALARNAAMRTVSMVPALQRAFARNALGE